MLVLYLGSGVGIEYGIRDGFSIGLFIGNGVGFEYGNQYGLVCGLLDVIRLGL